MKNPMKFRLLCTVAAVLSAASLFAAALPIDPATPMALPEPPAPRPHQPKSTPHTIADMPAAEPAAVTVTNAGFGSQAAFAAATAPTPDATTLSPPVTLTYSGGSPTLLINDSGTNKGVESLITNSHNSTSALYGLTNGSGAGLTGYNNGTGGPGGKFGITNANSTQPGAFTTTNGMGPALLATITNTHSGLAAIVGVGAAADYTGVGVDGSGGAYGLYGTSTTGTGVYGSSATYNGVWGNAYLGVGVYGETSSGIGVYGTSDSDTSYAAYFASGAGIGLYAYSKSNYGIASQSDSGTAMYANNTTSGHGITAHSVSGIGVYSSSDSGNAMFAQSSNSYAVIGNDLGSGTGVYGYSVRGTGVYGYSESGYAGNFQGMVAASSFITSSDRNLKTHIHAIDGKAMLDKVRQLPVSSWAFKSDPEKNHVGPMAQDFHAAFGLDGEDDKHINLTDIAGVSLAAIQELSSEMQRKDAQIAALQEQLKSLNDAVSMRLTALEQTQRSVLITQSAAPR